MPLFDKAHQPDKEGKKRKTEKDRFYLASIGIGFYLS